MIMVAVFLPEMCRRHMISITHMKKQPVAVLIAKRRIPERSVGTKTNTTKICVSERRDLYLGNIKQSNKMIYYENRF